MSDKSFKNTMALCNAILDGKPYSEIERKWRKAFRQVLKDMGFNAEARDAMWNELVSGNWERLHLTKAEKMVRPEQWLEAFRWDCWYCSDRWSLDRLMRCHWLWRNFASAREEWKELH